MKKQLQILTLASAVIALSAAARAAPAAEAEFCRAYGSICTTGFDCCSEICETFTDGKFRCGGPEPEV